MARKINIVSINPAAKTVTIGSHPDNLSGDWRGVFQGRFYRDPAAVVAAEKPPAWGGFRQELYSGPQPPGWELIEATTFAIRKNATFNGRYTVYTPINNSEFSSQFSGGQTTIRVVQDLPNPGPGHPDLTTGVVTDVTTYYIVSDLPGYGGYFIVPPEKSVIANGSEYVGYRFSGWGESIQQTIHTVIYKSTTSITPISTPSTTWTVTHNLGLPAPHLVVANFFWDDAGTIKPIFPASVTFSPNQVQATFSSAISGYVLIRP
jgi:hypothetical protein